MILQRVLHIIPYTKNDLGLRMLVIKHQALRIQYCYPTGHNFPSEYPKAINLSRQTKPVLSVAQ